MSTRPRRRAVVAAALAAAVLSGCTGTSSGGGDTNFVAGDGTLTRVPEDRRGQPVDLSGTTVDDETLDLATLRGKVVVVNVWGSWCPPCRKEAPDLQRAYEQLRPSGVEFVGITNRDTKAGAQAYERSFGITYPSLFDADGSMLLALRGAVPPSAIPSTLVLDAQGRIAARVSGATTAATLVGLVEDVQGAGA